MNFDRDGFYREVGLRVQQLRRREKYTQDRVATDLCMPRATYANIEAGRQRVPVDVIWRLSVILSVPVRALMPEPVRDPGAVAPDLPLSATGQPIAIPRPAEDVAV
jgi:transcriptional regulator with XRE-family HTH domain